MHDRPATRAEALRLMQAFAPRMGQSYASVRNYDRGPGRHRDVSILSPYIRRRLVTEPELVATALATHGADAAEKFIQEVIWRGYFKGWLERRPGIWTAYREGLNADLAAMADDRRLRHRIEAAEGGTTGIACFDAWAEELIETGYLHNHARMWFASIWIFTLRLPWRIGADFFYRHLLDGDPASNTLGWRWVAGLHTRGKPYAADAANIAKFTGRRFAPHETELADDVTGLAETEEPDGLPDPAPLRPVKAPDPEAPATLLITEEDLLPEDFAPRSLDLKGVATLFASHLRSPRPVAGIVADFEARALADAADRAGGAVALHAGSVPELVRWAESAGARQIVTPYIPRGPLFDFLEKARPALEARGIALCEWRRDWDGLIWPHATAGFFRVKKRIPDILRESGLT